MAKILETRGQALGNLSMRRREEHARGTVCCQMPRGDHAVAAVVPLTGQHQEAPAGGRRKQPARDLCRASSGRLHQLVAMNTVGFLTPPLQRRHLSGRGQFHRSDRRQASSAGSGLLGEDLGDRDEAGM